MVQRRWCHHYILQAESFFCARSYDRKALWSRTDCSYWYTRLDSHHVASRSLKYLSQNEPKVILYIKHRFRIVISRLDESLSRLVGILNDVWDFPILFQLGRTCRCRTVCEQNLLLCVLLVFNFEFCRALGFHTRCWGNLLLRALFSSVATVQCFQTSLQDHCSVNWRIGLKLLLLVADDPSNLFNASISWYYLWLLGIAYSSWFCPLCVMLYRSVHGQNCLIIVRLDIQGN